MHDIDPLGQLQFSDQQVLDYSLRGLSSIAQQKLYLISGLFNTLIHINIKCSEAHIAELKYQWWFEEIHHSYKNQPRHPIMQQMQDIGLLKQIPKQSLLELIQSIQLLAETQAVLSDEKDIQHAYQSSWGTLFQLFHVSENSCLDNHVLAGFCGRAQALLGMIPRLQAGLMDFSQQHLQQYNLSNQHLLDRQYHQQTAKLAQQLAQHYQLNLQQQLLDAPKHGMLQVYSRIIASLMSEVAHDPHAILHAKISLTPIRMLWISWRFR